MEETKFTDTLAELEKAKCHKCNKLVFTSEEIQNAVELRKAGKQITIVHESDFWDAVEDFS